MILPESPNPAINPPLHPDARFTEDQYARFWARVDRSGSCWLWTGIKNESGYGKFGDRYAHRCAYAMAFGWLDHRLYILHSCDNPSCVNPAHLAAGTQRRNLRDASDRGRTNNQFTLNKTVPWSTICALRARNEAGESQVKLAEEYGLALGYVNRVCRYLVRTTPPKNAAPKQMPLFEERSPYRAA